MGNCLITQKGGISDDDLQILAKAMSYSQRNENWEYLNTEHKTFTLTERTLCRIQASDRYEYKFLDKGTHSVEVSEWYGVDIASGATKSAYKFVGG